MPGESILLVGRSLPTEELASLLRPAGWHFERVDNLEAALERSRDRSYHAVLVDADSIGESPWPALDVLNDASDPVVLVVPPETSMNVFDGRPFRPKSFLTKPVDRAALNMAVESVLVYRRLLEENRALKRQLGSALSLNEWVGCTPESQEVRNSIATASLSAGPVLLMGEDGSGRKLAAEIIHRNGRHSQKTFVPIEMTSLPEGALGRLLEELVTTDGPGRFPAHTGGSFVPGTLFLSEINALSAPDQKALTELVSRSLPFRLMVSAHPSIQEAVRSGRFDRRLYELLAPLTIQIPPLRDRRGDVPMLIDHYLRRACERLGLQSFGIPPKAIDRYLSYDWPGNVAELSMVIERAVSIASAAKFEGTTLPEHFCDPPSLTIPEPSRLKSVSLRELIADIEKRLIIQTLDRVEGSQKRAAEKLRLNPTTLHEKMKRYKILPEKHRNIRSPVAV